MDIPYPSQHTMSSNHRPASEMPFKCFRCGIAKKEERNTERGVVWLGGGGRGVGDWLESHVETHSNFVVVFFVCLFFLCFFFFFFCMCCCFVRFEGGSKLLI